MVVARFVQKDEKLVSFSVSGHALFADIGLDIICASVTSAVQLTANAITEVLGVPAEVTVDPDGDRVSLTLPENCEPAAYQFVEALKLHFKLLIEEFEGALEVLVVEE